MKRTLLIKKMCLIAMFAALAYVLATVAHFLHLNIVPSVPFLSYDPKDVIICIGAFIAGPLSGVAVSVVVSLLEMITISTTGFYGLIMNIISSCALVVPAAIIYKHNKNFKGAILSLVIGFISVIIVMTLWNIIITPLYMNIDRAVLVKNFLLPIVIFNVIKVGLNIALILLLYKPIINVLRATGFVKKSENKSDKSTSLAMFLIGIILLVVLVIIWILLNKFA